MALTPADQKKMAQIEKDMAENQKKYAHIKQKCAEDFAKFALKFNLWKLDKKTVESELKALAEKHKTL